jgi:5,6-dimethylbenzimidazole synthase
MTPQFDPVFQKALASLVEWRRDVRHFTRERLAEQDVTELLALAQQAPSVGNSQPWRFVRILSDQLRETLAQHVDDEAVRAGANLASPDRRAAYAALKLHGLREASDIIAVFSDEATDAGSGLGTATMPETRAYSVVLAIHTLWLLARARGIALGWVSIVQPGYVATLLDVPDGWRLIAVLCLGRPAEASDTPELDRLGWQDRLDWRANVSVR